MGGQQAQILDRTTLTWGATLAAGVWSPETTLVSNVDVSAFSELQVLARLHAMSGTSGATVVLRVYPSAPTDEDPAQTFRWLPFVTLGFVKGAFGSIPPVVSMSDVVWGFGSHVDVTVQFQQGGQSSVSNTASISADFSLRDDRATKDLYTIGLLSSGNRFVGPASTGPVWSVTAGALAIVFRKIIAGNLTRDYRVHRWTAATRGWRGHVGIAANAQLLVGQVKNLPPATDVAAVNTVTLGQNVLHRVVLTNDNDTLKCYLDGAVQGTTAGMNDYLPPTTEALTIEGSGSVVDEIEIVSVSVGELKMDAVSVALWDAIVKAGGTRRLPLAYCHFEAEDWQGGPTTWVDRIAELTLGVSGTPVRRVIPASQVSWA